MGKTEKKSSRNKRLGLKTRFGKAEKCLRVNVPKGKRISKDAPLAVSVTMDYFLELLFEDLKKLTDQGKHQVSPKMLAELVGDKKKSYYKMFPEYIGGIHVRTSRKSTKEDE